MLFVTDNGVVFGELDVPVNAAATALKDYLKQIPPLLPQVQLEELTSIASKFTPTLHCQYLTISHIINTQLCPSTFHHTTHFTAAHFTNPYRKQNCVYQVGMETLTSKTDTRFRFFCFALKYPTSNPIEIEKQCVSF